MKNKELDLYIDEEEITLLRATAEMLSQFIQRHAKDNQSFSAVQAIIKFTTEQIDIGKSGEALRCSAAYIADIAKFPLGDKSPGSKLAGPWKALHEKHLPEHERGLQEFAANAGMNFYAWPMKHKSSGGTESLYFLAIRPVPTDILDRKTVVPEGYIQYIRELEPKPAWWLRYLVVGGFHLRGWRRNLFLGYLLCVATSLVWLSIFVWWFIFSSTHASIQSLFYVVSGCTILGWFLFGIIKPFIKLLDWRIIMAPSPMLAFSENDVQLEMVREAVQEGKPIATIRLVRYASTCPICQAKINIADGNKEFPNRLVGRCQDNPAEHVYSFDRSTCLGKILR